MAGVYISFPFCSQKCTYCNFASGVLPKPLERDYIGALADELRSHGWRWEPDTVYLGGGTPSQIEPQDLRSILALVPGAPWAEATIEAAPGTLTPERVASWVACGVNRVSLGVQSFSERELARTGRKHRAATVAADVALLRERGIDRINIDLIAGLPGQTTDTWQESLDWIDRLAPDHASVYMLEVDEDSRLGRELLAGGTRYGASDVPSEELIVELYETAVDRLAALGLRRYEISNFARPGRESLHNLKYWNLEPYAGFGADAHSFDGTTRTQNVESAAEYVERWRYGSSPAAAKTQAKPDEERFFVGLRLTDGIEPRPEDWARFANPIDRFVRDGLLERKGQRIRLTRRGVLFSNEVFSEFVA